MTSQHESPVILIVDDVPQNLNLLRTVIEPEGYRILCATNGADALRIARTTKPDAILLDVFMPGINGFEVCQTLQGDPATRDILVIFVTMKDDRFGLEEGFGVGAVDYIAKPFEPAEVILRLKTHLSLRQLRKDLADKNQTLEETVDALRETNQKLENEIQTRQRLETSLANADQQISRLTTKEAKKWGIDAFVGQSQETERVISEIRQLQKVEKTSVLVLGESGTGKELVARAIHFGGPNAKGPFVAVNCTAITKELAESAFFGHIKGSFSGAYANQKGYFEQANGGTLFLDEIGDMPLPLQAKLLRALETGTIQPIGSEKTMAVQVRILAATNQDLTRQISEKTFRQDLYFRLSGFTLSLPALRERRDDIQLLAQHFIGLLSAEMGRELGQLSEGAKNALSEYSFPGNIRELKNIIEHALIKSGDGYIETEHLHLVERDLTASHRSQSTPLDRCNDVETWERTRQRVINRAQKKHPLNTNGAGVHGANPTDEERILEYLRDHESMSNTECRELLSVDQNQARHLLRKLCSYGLLLSEGDRRWRRYRLAVPGSL